MCWLGCCVAGPPLPRRCPFVLACMAGHSYSWDGTRGRLRRKSHACRQGWDDTGETE